MSNIPPTPPVGPPPAPPPGGQWPPSPQAPRPGRSPVPFILAGVGALIVIAGLVVVLVLTLGGGDSKSKKSEDTNSTSTDTNLWTSAEEDAFLASCTGGGAPSSTCRCALGKVEARYPDPADLETLTIDERTAVGRQAALDCR